MRRFRAKAVSILPLSSHLLALPLLALLFPHSASAGQPACMKKVPAVVKYRPSLPQCGGKAAIILSGKYSAAFSVVIRDHDGNDRDPLNPECADNICSPFKVHHRHREGGAQVHCLGASGFSQVYRTARRITIKKRNPVRDIYKDIDRFCIKDGVTPLN